ncbi:choice-of-anchor D domain-containing protein [Aestuariibacter halophilus]|uniref:Choice-of-anchor D domain-containing protein n=1 Tax=Fluctibacter halophilus TaxID=226011 RepID=A0ABS8G2F3_9ALTE|nr:choice-of-anchor D domain-containing protein [Aestuariibacter halophilus]MCC2614674.1 choice-of-anchor D domain-containing protein [Aestuariibacter halophilus]
MKIALRHALGISLLLTSSTALADITEDFEDANLDGWTTSGQVEINTIKTLGNYSMRLKGGATAERAFAADGDVTVALAATSLESNDFCEVYVSEDGQNWGGALITLNSVQDNGAFSTATTTTNGGVTHIRYVQTGTSADYCYADGIQIVGAGIPQPVAELSGSGAFGSVLVGSSASSSFSLANTGNADLTVTTISGVSAPFSLANDGCSNTTVLAGQACTFDVVYAPTAVGSDNASMTVANSDQNRSAALSGSGTDNSTPPPSVDLHVFTGAGNVARTALTLAQLNGTSLNLTDYGAFSHGQPEINADASNAAQPSNVFEGRLVLNGGNATPLNFDETTSGRAQAGNYVAPGTLPAFDFEFVQSGSHIIPKTRGLIVTAHGDWNYILEPGRVWNENNDQGYSRVAIPFALQEKQANCTHNGMMTFAFKDDGSVTNVAVQVGAETCLYFQYNLWGMVDAQYVQGAVTDANGIITAYQAEVANRYPTKPLTDIAVDFPGVVAANFAAEQSAGATTHGVLYNGVHYAAPCSTRFGDYPYCEVMSLPSYSTAKTATANFAHALLTQQYGDTARYMSVSQNVAECQDGINGTDSIWSDVTVENALDMATGNYRLSSYEGDEGSSNVLNNFFLVYTHDQKIQHACERYIRKSAPDTHFSYHSSDTYIAGVAMDNFYTAGDLFDKLVDEVYKPLNLSPVTYTSVRTDDAVADPFWSHGMTWHKDDMIKLGQVINDRGVINGQQVMSAAIMDDMLLKGGDLGLETYGAESTYLNGVWTYDMGQRSTPLCPTGSWVSYMSGYGGIGIVMFPNGAVYYFVSDSNSFAFGGAEAELHKISNICGQ